MASEHMQAFAAAGFDSGAGSNFDYSTSFRQTSQPFHSQSQHFKQPHAEFVQRPYNPQSLQPLQPLQSLQSLQSLQGGAIAALQGQDGSQKSMLHPHQRSFPGSAIDHVGYQNVSNFQAFRPLQVPPGFPGHGAVMAGGQQVYQSNANGLPQGAGISSGGPNIYNQSFNGTFLSSPPLSANGFTKNAGGGFHAYDVKFDPTPKATQNSLAALGVDDGEPDWESAINNSNLDVAGDVAHEVSYPIGQDPLSPTQDLGGRAFNHSPTTPVDSNTSPWGIQSTAPIYAPPAPVAMNTQHQPAGFPSQSSYPQAFYHPHGQRTMSLGGNQFGYFNLSNDRRPSVPVTMMVNPNDAIAGGQPLDFYGGPPGLRPTSSPGTLYSSSQGMQPLQTATKLAKQPQNNLVMNGRQPDAHSAGFRLPEWGGLGFTRTESHSQQLLQEVGTNGLDYAIVSDIVDGDVAGVTGSMALYSDSVDDEIIPNNKASSSARPDTTEFPSHISVQSLNDGSTTFVGQPSQGHPLTTPSITSPVTGDVNHDSLVRQRSSPSSSQWSTNTHAGNENFYAAPVGSVQNPGTVPMPSQPLGSSHHAQQVFIRSISPTAAIGFGSPGASPTEVYSPNELVPSLDQLSLGSVAAVGGSVGGEEIRDASKLPSPPIASGPSKKIMSWAAIAKTPAKPTPQNAANAIEMLPSVPSQKTPPSSVSSSGSWASMAKAPGASRPLPGGIVPGKSTVSNSSGLTVNGIKKELPPGLAQKGFNPKGFNIKPDYARYFVIKSYTEDDVHKSLKYDIWASTDIGNRRLDKAYRESAHSGPIFLFFSVNASGHFCGMAEMISHVDYSTTSTVWAQDKWKGVFKVRWIFVKDIPNGSLRHIRLINNENKPVTNSRDTQELYPEPGREMLKVFFDYKSRTSILDDFEWYDQKQTEQEKDCDLPDPSTEGWEEAVEVEE